MSAEYVEIKYIMQFYYGTLIQLETYPIFHSRKF